MREGKQFRLVVQGCRCSEVENSPQPIHSAVQNTTGEDCSSDQNANIDVPVLAKRLQQFIQCAYHYADLRNKDADQAHIPGTSLHTHIRLAWVRKSLHDAVRDREVVMGKAIDA